MRQAQAASQATGHAQAFILALLWVMACLNTIVHVIDFGMDLYDAMNAPRFHCEATESSCYFEATYDSAIVNQLVLMGHVSARMKSIGAQHGVQFDPVTGLSTMSVDLRDDRSTAAGFQK